MGRVAPSWACNGCGGDFRGQTTAHVPPGIGAAVEDFAALAPFRVALHGGVLGTARWDEAFAVFKSLLLPNAAWAGEEWPEAYARGLTVEERHRAVEALAAVRHGAAYWLTELDRKALRALRPLAAIPRPLVAERRAIRFLVSSGAIDAPIADSVVARSAVQEQSDEDAALREQFPRVTSASEVMSVLGIDANAESGLRALGIVRKPAGQDDGYDSLHLLQARRFLGEGLLTLEELDALVGVPLTNEDLADSGLLPRWNPKDKQDARVRVEGVEELQAQLTMLWHASGAHVGRTPLSALGI